MFFEVGYSVLLSHLTTQEMTFRILFHSTIVDNDLSVS